MSSILFTGKFTNLHQGFEELHESGSLPDRESSKTAREYVDRLLPWLEQHRDVPFFVFLHVSDPHDPYKPDAPYDTMWADRSKTKTHEKQQDEVRKSITDPLLKAFGMPTRAELAKAGFDPDAYVGFDRDWYDGSIRGMDAEIGRVMELLRSPAFADRTVVVFAGDHGEEFLEHGRTFHGQSVYGELANTPLIFWGPGLLPGGSAVDDTVETIDVMPTILELCGLSPPEGIQGASLKPLLISTPAGASWSERPAFTEKAVTKGGGGAPPPYETESFAVTLGGWKLIHNTKQPLARPEYELFDAKKDPLNLENVASAHGDVVEQLKTRIDAWRKQTLAARVPSDEDIPKDISPEDLERLRSLGYVQ
jgi:arylsulfatase A-like enzyme